MQFVILLLALQFSTPAHADYESECMKTAARCYACKSQEAMQRTAKCKAGASNKFNPYDPAKCDLEQRATLDQLQNQCSQITYQSPTAAADEDISGGSGTNTGAETLTETSSVAKIASKSVKAPAQEATKSSPSTAEKDSSKASSSDPAAKTADGSANLGNADADVLACQNTRDSASTCCGSPNSCLSDSEKSTVDQGNNQITALTAQASSSTSGFNNNCTQQQSLGDASAKINSAYATACFRVKTSCQQTCSSMLTKYQQLSQSCNGCASQAVYDDAVADLTSLQNSCSRLSATVNTLGAQGLAGAGNSGLGQTCDSMTSASPSSAATDSAASSSLADSGSGFGTNSSTSAPSVLEGATANGVLARANAGSANGFNVASVSPGDSGFGSVATRKPSGGGMDVQAVANNTGGGIPGGGGSGGGAKLDSKRAPASAKPGYSTDVDQGERSGAGYTYGQGGDGNGNGSGFEVDRRLNQRAARRDLASDGQGIIGMDLKKYLPGGALDPNRMGGFNARNQINGPHVDIWDRISTRLQEKCKLGQLYDCK